MMHHKDRDAHRELVEQRHDCEPKPPEPERQGWGVVVLMALIVTLAIVLASIAGQWIMETTK